jgi:arylsulfatase A-like enzyme
MHILIFHGDCMNKILNNKTLINPQYIRYITLTILSAYIYVFMEWIFFVTKPSFMDFMSVGEKLSILFGSGLFVAVSALILLSLFAAMDFLVNKHVHTTIQFGNLPASFILASLGLLLFDNFTYTVFRFGVITSIYTTRFLYILFYCSLLYYFYTRTLFHIDSIEKKKSKIIADKKVFVFCLALIGASLLFTISDLSQNPILQPDNRAVSEGIRKPNIIIFGTDGIEASHMSAYGYKRETTPVIAKLAKKSLLAENNFTNACCSAGSIASTLTGKLPIETHLLYSPDILQGQASYQHLLYLLKQEGYSTFQLGNILHVNANKWNMLSGFDMINGKKQNGWIATLSKHFGNNTVYFISEMEKRLTKRILHIFYVEDMDNAIVTDTQKVQQVVDIIKNNKEPFFVHVHLLNSHGPKYHIGKQIFSAGKQNANWQPDFMDDAILQYDRYTGKILNALEEKGQIDNTIFIIYTDHGSKWETGKRIPLIIHFPRDEYAGKIESNVQNLDIAPTILDYMNLPKPDWMRGTSLLKPIDKHRLIFSFIAPFLLLEKRAPPFFQFGAIRVIECQRWYKLDLINKGPWQSGDIQGHTTPCNEDELRSSNEVQSATLKLLMDNGFDVSSLKSP